MPVRRIAQLTGVAVAASVLFIGVTVLANHARFGRYELTNSSGRHVWQGVMAITDNAQFRGLNWWEVPPEGFFITRQDPREPLLAVLSRQTIREKPGQYLLQGVKKFVTTITVPPYYFGTGGTKGHTNPLNRTELLPSMASVMHAGAYEKVVHGVMRRLYIAFKWIYPVTIVVIGVTWVALVVRRERRSAGPLISFYSFLALVFFGTLWFSWQVEIENSRNAVPYMPLWAIMLAMAVEYWRRLIFKPRESH
jgi:hypothetical protein